MASTGGYALECYQCVNCITIDSSTTTDTQDQWDYCFLTNNGDTIQRGGENTANVPCYLPPDGSEGRISCCETNRCNNWDAHLTCYACDSCPNVNEFTPKNSSELANFCVEEKVNGSVSRYGAKTCQNENKENNYKKCCSNNLCNNQPSPLTCYDCNNCLTVNSNTKQNSDSTWNYCVESEDKGIVSRTGRVDKMEQDAFSCSVDLCNNHRHNLSCYQCDHCPQVSPSNTNIVDKSDWLYCFERKSNGYVGRGGAQECKDEIQDEDNYVKCCSDSLCNNHLVPLKCYTCDNCRIVDENSPVQSNGEWKYCVETDNKGVVSRSGSAECKDSETIKCCDNDLCNNLRHSLSCYHCDHCPRVSSTTAIDKKTEWNHCVEEKQAGFVTRYGSEECKNSQDGDNYVKCCSNSLCNNNNAPLQCYVCTDCRAVDETSLIESRTDWNYCVETINNGVISRNGSTDCAESDKTSQTKCCSNDLCNNKNAILTCYDCHQCPKIHQDTAYSTDKQWNHCVEIKKNGMVTRYGAKHCVEDNETKCCSEKFCNDGNYPLSCYTCDKCRIVDEKTNIAQDNSWNYCVTTRQNNNDVSRGGSLTCSSADKDCCTRDYCNNWNSILTCYDCKNCARVNRTTSTSANSEWRFCAEVKEKGIVSRMGKKDCKTEMKDEENYSTCCSDSLCNNLKSTLKCYECENCPRVTKTTESKYNSTWNFCFTKVYSDKVIRGGGDVCSPLYTSCCTDDLCNAATTVKSACLSILLSTFVGIAAIYLWKIFT